MQRLIAAVKQEFGADGKRIGHVLKVLARAQELLREEDADSLIVCAAALLHDIGIQAAERKHGSASGKYQELEGPPIARRIMAVLGLAEPVIDHVCKIVDNHHSAREIDTTEFRIVWDADWLTNLPEESPETLKRRLPQLGRLLKPKQAGMGH